MAPVGLFLFGSILGVAYFWGLWLSVRRLPGSTRPRRLMGLSFLGRLILAAAGFACVLGSGAAGMAVCLAGFLLVRQVMTFGLRARLKPLATGGGR